MSAIKFIQKRPNRQIYVESGAPDEDWAKTNGCLCSITQTHEGDWAFQLGSFGLRRKFDSLQDAEAFAIPLIERRPALEPRRAALRAQVDAMINDGSHTVGWANMIYGSIKEATESEQLDKLAVELDEREEWLGR